MKMSHKRETRTNDNRSDSSDHRIPDENTTFGPTLANISRNKKRKPIYNAPEPFNVNAIINEPTVVHQISEQSPLNIIHHKERTTISDPMFGLEHRPQLLAAPDNMDNCSSAVSHFPLASNELRFSSHIQPVKSSNQDISQEMTSKGIRWQLHDPSKSIQQQRCSDRPITQPKKNPIFFTSVQKSKGKFIFPTDTNEQQRDCLNASPFEMTTTATAINQNQAGPSCKRNQSPPPTIDIVQRYHTIENIESTQNGPGIDLQPLGVSSVYLDLGNCNQVCQHCKATFWYEERLKTFFKDHIIRYSHCCGGGTIVLPMEREPPDFIKDLYRNKHFLENIRAYNQMFSMTSFGAHVDESLNNGRGPYVFKISGQIYHWIGTLCPIEGDPPRFLQLYIYDTHNEVKNRLHHFGGEENSKMNPQIVKGLIKFLNEHNELVRLFRTARDICEDADVPEFKIRLYSLVGAREYELPTSETLGAIVYESGRNTKTDYDVIIEVKDGMPQRINKLHPSYMSLQFPLLFIYGQHGFHPTMKLTNLNCNESVNIRRLTMNMYYTYQLHDRLNMYGLIPRGGRLFQQYVVTAYCSIELNRMDYIRDKQNDIRNEYLSGLYDAIMRGDQDGSDVGTRTILPASFTGGPRYMYSHYLDALAICRVHGNPQFFITFTCNVKWPEINRYMENYPELTPTDRADIVDRVFQMKVQQFITFLKDKKLFGRVTAVLYTIEFQKRGLPHCHTLLWVKPASKIETGEDVDQYISAELPDQTFDPDGYKIVSEMMMHGPCGLANSRATCMQDGICNKNFPKKYNDKTFFDKDGYVHYRRRNTGIYTIKRHINLDNSYVVPYNRLLCLAFHAHINVEYCGWTMLIKYLFKYISKGTDRVIAHITRPVGESCSSKNQRRINIDEIQNFIDARYICPHEACWRIFGFNIHHREPAVQILAVHLQNMQQISFRAGQPLQSVVNDFQKKKTTLTQWLEFNASSQEGHHLTYLNFPSEFVWYPTEKRWKSRANKKKPLIGRLTYIHPTFGEVFYLRMLLCHQKGCRSFQNIRTVDNKIFSTYRGACEALGLLGDDKEWTTTLEEASLSASSAELRSLFAHILIFCEVTDPLGLWKKQWKKMTDDIPKRISASLHIQNVHVNNPDLEGYALYELETILNCCSKSLKDFGLPLPPEHLRHDLQNKLLMEEKNYDRDELMKQQYVFVSKLNGKQKYIYDMIINASTNNKQQLIFVYGHGGTGKTFLWKTIITALRSEGKIVLAVASSGIASLLLPSGRTAHSRFKLPIDLTDESMCNIKKSTHMADLLAQTDLIIWDEAPMNDRRCFETLDRTLRDILNTPNLLFGGKTIMLGGDFRQTLPVKKGASKMDLINASIVESYLWPQFKIYTLEENMRLLQVNLNEYDKKNITAFSSWLLDIGDGKDGELDQSDVEDVSWINIPDRYCIPDEDNSISKLINFIYDEETLQNPTAERLQQQDGIKQHH